MNDGMSDLKCGLTPESAQTVSDLSVGQILHLRCEGDWIGWGDSAALNLQKWQLRFDGMEADPYRLKILSATKAEEATGVYDVQLVSYRVGTHPLKAIQMVSDEASVVLGDYSLNVKTAQSEEEPVTEPFGPWSAMSGPLPWMTLGGLLLVLALIGYLILRPILRRRKHARWMKELPPQRFSIPEQELYKVMRTSMTLSRLKEAFQVYLARKFNIPAHRMPRAQVVRLIREQVQTQDSKSIDALQELLSEFDKFDGVENLSEKDSAAMLSRITRFLDAVEKYDAQKVQQ